ncbi:MAG TPA: twin-arginine translocase TatA/TatE family subunit [Blastocatellia bacterium]|jgi:TatA/E family protein of Tat protein translocase
MGNLGWPEILIILTIALIIFGPRKLPQLGKSLGESLAQFRRASEDFKRTWEREVEVEQHRIEAPLINDGVTEASMPAEETATTHAESHYEDQPATVDEQTDSADKHSIDEHEVAAVEPRHDWT